MFLRKTIFPLLFLARFFSFRSECCPGRCLFLPLYPARSSAYALRNLSPSTSSYRTFHRTKYCALRHAYGIRHLCSYSYIILLFVRKMSTILSKVVPVSFPLKSIQYDLPRSGIEGILNVDCY